jgi:hypothetical protein
MEGSSAVDRSGAFQLRTQPLPRHHRIEKINTANPDEHSDQLRPRAQLEVAHAK